MYEDKTPESIKAEILSGITGLDKREGSYIDTLISPIAYQIWKYYTALEAVIPILFVDETSGEYIDKRCADYGITRKPGTKAVAAMAFFGEDGTIIPEGKAFSTQNGLVFLLKSAITITDGTAAGEAEAQLPGSGYNVGENTIVSQAVALAGLESWTNEAAQGGTDEESDGELVARLYERLQNPATSGNTAHYMMWAKETAGVGDCRVLSLWNGAGTVKLVIIDQEGQPASAQILAACEEHVEEVRPIGADVTVAAADAVPVSVSAGLTLDGTAILSDVKSRFEASLSEYLKSIAFEKNTVLYSQIGYLLLGTQGVQDYTDLTVNNGTANINLTQTQVPVKGEITFVTD